MYSAFSATIMSESSNHIVITFSKHSGYLRKFAVQQYLHSSSHVFIFLLAGELGGLPTQVAADILDGIGEFIASCNPQQVNRIKITVLDPYVADQFKPVFKSKVGKTYGFRKENSKFKVVETRDRFSWKKGCSNLSNSNHLLKMTHCYIKIHSS